MSDPTPSPPLFLLAGAILLVVCLAILPTHQAQAEAAGPFLLPPGGYHAEEVTVPSGSGWLALFVGSEEGAPRLEATEVVIEAVHDPFVDAEGEATGKLVKVASEGPEPLLLLTGSHGLDPGPVIEASPAEGVLPGPEPLRITLGDKLYELTHELNQPPGPNDPPGEPLPGSLVLRSGDAAQSLADFHLWYDPNTGAVTFIGDDAFTRLLWAGDLDGDGQLDLYLDLTDHYNVSQPTLLLSSAASEGDLVAVVASHISYGC